MPPLETNTGKPIMIIFGGIISAGGKDYDENNASCKKQEKNEEKEKRHMKIRFFPLFLLQVMLTLEKF